MNYYIELVKKKYWHLYLDTVTDYISKFVNNPQKFKIKQKILSYNTYLIGLSPKQTNVFQPPKKLIYKHSDEFYSDLIYNYNTITESIFTDILKYMIDTRNKLNKLEKIELKNIPNKIVVKKVYKQNSVELSLNDYVHSINIIDYGRLASMYSNKKIPVDYAICTLLLRYDYYGPLLQGICLSAELAYNWVKKNKYEKITLELFAGSLNSNLPNYCSLFYDIEKYFGSKGSMFLYKNINNYDILVSNPPFLTNVMTESAKLIVKYLKTSSKKSSIVFVNIPDWRSRKQYNRDETTASHIKKNEIAQARQDAEYLNYEILRNSPYFRKVILFGNFKYKNFFGQNYATIRDNILILILTTMPNDSRIQDFLDYSNSVIQ